MKTSTYKVKNGEALEINAVGDYVRVTSAAVGLLIENLDANEAIEVSQGDDFQFSPFQRLRVSHSDAAEQTIKLTVSKGKKAGSSQVSGSITGAVTVSNKDAVSGAFAQGRASVTNANQAIIAANAARRYCLIQNNSLSAVLRVNLAGVAATAAQGFRVQPGGMIEVPTYCTTAAINAMMETADATAGNVEFVTG